MLELGAGELGFSEGAGGGLLGFTLGAGVLGLALGAGLLGAGSGVGFTLGAGSGRGSLTCGAVREGAELPVVGLVFVGAGVMLGVGSGWVR